MTTPPPETLFAALARLARHLEATPKRLEKRGLLAEFLRSLQREEIAPAVHLVVGRIFAEADARALNVGWATLRRALEGKRQTTLVAEPLTVLEASRAFAAIAATHGPDSVRERRRLLESLLGRVDPADRDILLRILFGEMRIGVNEGVMLEGIAEAADLPAENVRTAHMFLGDLGRVAEIALSEGLPGLRSAGLRLLSPVKPMLAEMAEDPDDVLTEHGGEPAIEFKLDGARIQIPRAGGPVRADRELARGPARLCQALGIDRALDGADVCDPASPLRVRSARSARGGPATPPISRGPRVGVNSGAQRPWRFWLTGDPTVSPYRPHVPRVRPKPVWAPDRSDGTMQQ